MFKLIIKVSRFLIPILIILFSSCDIIDEITGQVKETENESDNSNISEIEVEYFIDNANYYDANNLPRRKNVQL